MWDEHTARDMCGMNIEGLDMCGMNILLHIRRAAMNILLHTGKAGICVGSTYCTYRRLGNVWDLGYVWDEHTAHREGWDIRICVG